MYVVAGGSPIPLSLNMPLHCSSRMVQSTAGLGVSSFYCWNSSRPVECIVPAMATGGGVQVSQLCWRPFWSHTLHTWEVSPLEGSAGFKFIFSAHLHAMALKTFVGTKKMCMFHEPTGFWPKIFLNIFLGHSKVTVMCISKSSNELH